MYVIWILHPLYKLLPTTFTNIHSKMDNGKNKILIGNGKLNPKRSCHKKPMTARPICKPNQS